MNNKSSGLGMALKIIFYAAVVVLTLYGWFGELPGLSLTVGYALLGLAIGIVLIFSIIQLLDDPKKSIKSLIGLAAVAVIFLIAYSGASPETISTEATSENHVKLAGASLTLLYISGGVAVASIVLSELYSLIK